MIGQRTDAIQTATEAGRAINEFLKEHQKIEDQDRKLKEQQVTIAQLRKNLQATGAQQQKEIEALTAGLQKVNAQMGLSKGAPQTVSNNQ